MEIETEMEMKSERDGSRKLNQVQQKPDFTNHPAGRGWI